METQRDALQCIRKNETGSKSIEETEPDFERLFPAPKISIDGVEWTLITDDSGGMWFESEYGLLRPDLLKALIEAQQRTEV